MLRLTLYKTPRTSFRTDPLVALLSTQMRYLRLAPKKLDHKLRCILERTAQPVEGQNDGPETTAPYGDLTNSGLRQQQLKAVRQLAGCQMNTRFAPRGRIRGRTLNSPGPIRLDAPYSFPFCDLLTGPNHTMRATPLSSDFHSASERLSP